MITRQLDGVPLSLAQDFDFAFLADYGRVFAVFDDQDSGNLCLGVERDGQKRFLKLAGARTLRANVGPEAAIQRLMATVPIYEALRHPLLLNIDEHRPVPGGYLACFPWFEGACMGKQYGQFERFIALPIEEKLEIYDCILDFHAHVASLRYVAIDFYDGCILYDFDARRTMFCDIEFYRKSPYVNDMGRMWGSHRYMSPEEFTLGADIDELSNVFMLGAAAFQLLGAGMDRAPERWQAGPAAYEVAMRALSSERVRRQPSVARYILEWRAALR